jgi:hypothetical protein
MIARETVELIGELPFGLALPAIVAPNTRVIRVAAAGNGIGNRLSPLLFTAHSIALKVIITTIKKSISVICDRHRVVVCPHQVAHQTEQPDVTAIGTSVERQPRASKRGEFNWPKQQ